jgi:hypothetical protein
MSSNQAENEERENNMLKSILLPSAIALAVVGNASAADKWTDEETLAGLKTLEHTRYALSGSPLRLRFLYALGPDCSFIDGWQYAVIKEPEHGTAEIVPYTAFPSFAKDNPRFKCNEQQIQGQALIYKPNDNYEGRDSFTFLDLTPSGFAQETTYTFNVRAFKGKSKPAVKADAESMPLPPVTIRPKSN